MVVGVCLWPASGTSWTRALPITGRRHEWMERCVGITKVDGGMGRHRAADWVGRGAGEGEQKGEWKVEG
jgi:hypothetical protein